MESIFTLNNRLIREYGLFDDMRANWRIVHSENEFEKRWSDCDANGNVLANRILVEVPKYRQYIHNKYVLERLIPMDMFTKTNLVLRLSYEPVFVFEDKNGDPLPPNWDVCKIVIGSVYKKAAEATGVRYKDPDWNKDEAVEVRRKRVEGLVEQLFGNETEVGDALRYQQGVSFAGLDAKTDKGNDNVKK